MFLESISGLVRKVEEKGISVRVFNISSLSSSFDARKYVIDTLKADSTIGKIIFTDTDDYYDCRRFELAIKGLKESDFVFNSFLHNLLYLSCFANRLIIFENPILDGS